MLPTPASVDWFSRNDFRRGRAPRRRLGQRLGGELGRERLDPQPAAEPLLERLGAEQEALAEAAGVREPELRGRRQAGTGPASGAPPRGHGRGGDRPRQALGRPADQQKVAGHPQVHDQRLLTVEAHQQVLAAPIQALDRPPGDCGFEARRRQRPRPALVEHLKLPRSASRPARARAGGGSSRLRAARARVRGYPPRSRQLDGNNLRRLRRLTCLCRR